MAEHVQSDFTVTPFWIPNALGCDPNKIQNESNTPTRVGGVARHNKSPRLES